jgi:hypothetical protein
MDERHLEHGNDEAERERRLRAAAKLMALGALRVFQRARTASDAAGEKGPAEGSADRKDSSRPSPSGDIPRA